MRLESSRLDSDRLPSTPLDSTRPRPNHRAPATLTHSTQWRRPGFLRFSAATAPRIRDLIYTDVAQVCTRVCTDVPTAWRILCTALSHLFAPSYYAPLCLSFSLFSSVSTSRLWLCRAVRCSLALVAAFSQAVSLRPVFPSRECGLVDTPVHRRHLCAIATAVPSGITIFRVRATW